MPQTVAEVLAAVSRELRHLANLTTTLQDRLSPRVYEDGDIEAFQSLDALNQTLDCLASYVAHVGVLAPSQQQMEIDEAISRVSLAELAGRLCGDAQSPMRVATPEVELF